MTWGGSGGGERLSEGERGERQVASTGADAGREMTREDREGVHIGVKAVIWGRGRVSGGVGRGRGG